MHPLYMGQNGHTDDKRLLTITSVLLKGNAHSSEKDHPFRRKVITCSDEKDHLLNRSEATRVIQIVL